MASDLKELVQHLRENWKLERFHLLGHSFGGAVGYEFLKRQTENRNGSDRSSPQCLSFILSNASTNFELSSSEQKRLFQEFQLQQLQTRMPVKQQQTKNLSIQEQFFQTHICRTPEKPVGLESALNRRHKQWSANDYAISAADTSTQFPPVLIIRGECDFVTQACTEGWREVFEGQNGYKELVIKDSAHYPHFEKPEAYSYEIEQFCSTAERP